MGSKLLLEPVTDSGHISTMAYKNVLQRIKDRGSSTPVLAITGPPASGKTALAYQACAEVWMETFRRDNLKPIFRKFDCSSPVKFYNDLLLLYEILDISTASLSLGGSWEGLIQALHMDMKTQSRTKLFIFDDVEQVGELLRSLNHICSKEHRLPGWMVLITAQTGCPGNFDAIGPNIIVPIEGFDIEETMKLFDGCELDRDDVTKIWNALGPLPLPLRICMESVKSHRTGDEAEFVESYLKQIEIVGSGVDKTLTALKISIERAISDISFRDHSDSLVKLVKIISFFNGKILPIELLIACAETVTEEPELAAWLTNNLLGRLIERKICSKLTDENTKKYKINLYSLHQLVKQSMRLFVDEEEKLELLRCVLVALTRVIPKDGRSHQTYLVAIYGNHGETTDRLIRKMPPHIRQDSFVQMLHCSLLVGMGYCLLVQHKGSRDGHERLAQARDKFCELVSGDNYKTLVELESIREGEGVHKALAKGLYSKACNLPMIRESAEYRRFIRCLPEYHRLTKKDLGSMMSDPVPALVNDHLAKEDLERYRASGKVIDEERLAKLYLSELLAQLFCVWSKEQDRTVEGREEYIEHMESAIEVYNKISNARHGTYLLAALMMERDMLEIRSKRANSSQEVRSVIHDLDELSRVGEDKAKLMAFEEGLMRSDLSKDLYHVLVCKQKALGCYGQLYEFERKPQPYTQGIQLFQEVERLARQQTNRAITLSFSYRTYARFLCCCEKFDEAVLATIKAMEFLHKHCVNVVGGGSSNPFPEFSHHAFDKLYSEVKQYYSLYCQIKKSGETLLRDDMDEWHYLRRAIEGLRQVELNSGRQADGPSQYEHLDIISNDVQESMGELASTY